MLYYKLPLEGWKKLKYNCFWGRELDGVGGQGEEEGFHYMYSLNFEQSEFIAYSEIYKFWDIKKIQVQHSVYTYVTISINTCAFIKHLVQSRRARVGKKSSLNVFFALCDDLYHKYLLQLQKNFN